MKLKLEITKAGRRLHEGVYEVDDNATFGAACADAWVKIREQCAARATSIGALMDSMHESSSGFEAARQPYSRAAGHRPDSLLCSSAPSA